MTELTGQKMYPRRRGGESGVSEVSVAVGAGIRAAEAAYVMSHADGLRSAVLMTAGFSGGFAFACRLKGQRGPCGVPLPLPLPLLWLWWPCVSVYGQSVAVSEPPLSERIDGLLEAVVPGLELAEASDAEFHRRLYLDLVGRGPTVQESERYLVTRDIVVCQSDVCVSGREAWQFSIFGCEG